MAFKTKAEKIAYKKGLFAGLFGNKQQKQTKIKIKKVDKTNLIQQKKSGSGFKSLNEVPNWCKHNVLFSDGRYKGLYHNFVQELGLDHEEARDLALDNYKKLFGDSVLKKHYDL